MSNTFSMKPTMPETTNGGNGQSVNVSDEQWQEWNNYYWSLFDAKESPATNREGAVREGVVQKRKKYVGILKGIVDIGFQPQQDSSYEWKGVAGKGDELSDEEKAHVTKYPDNYFKDVDGKRMQFKPTRPTQEFALYFDTPKVMVDWTKHPIEALHSLGQKPLRVCYNGFVNIPSRGIKDLGKHLRFNPNWQTKKLSPNNPLMKIATSLNVASEYQGSDYDIGVFAEQACNLTLVIDKSKDRFFTVKIIDHSEISDIEVGDNTVTREQQIPECPSEFFGVLMNGGSYTEDVLKWVSNREELQFALPRSTTFQPNAVKNPDFFLGADWSTSDLCKALGEGFGQERSPQGSSDTKPEQKPVKKEEPKQEEPSGMEDEGLDWDDSVPF